MFLITFLILATSIRDIDNKEACARICMDGTCIPWASKCDGRIDCPDGSDETKMMCSFENCRARDEQSFQCEYGACVSRDAPCNGVKDCVDNSDELLPWCPRVTRGKFVCDSNSSVAIEKVCDSHKDCPNGSDETAELCGKLACDGFQFRCDYGACIKFRASCNGKIDCVDGSDETAKLCQGMACRPGNFRCQYGGCIPSEALCDGTTDCADNSDEKQPWCRNITDGKFKCGDGGFINKTVVCNGVKDCADGSDETATLCTNTICNDKQFQCKYGACIPITDKCDAKLDCFDGSDEMKESCIENKCSREQFQCAYGGCVSRSTRCDGVKDCHDNSDEMLPWCANITNGIFKCVNKGVQYAYNITTDLVCDGLGNCGDQSDETEALCGGNTCHANQFRCDYGACIPEAMTCDGVAPGPDACTDLSDESFELCNSTRCFYPPNPDHGQWFNVLDSFYDAVNYYALDIRVECDEGYGLLGNRTMSCKAGVWTKGSTECLRYCTLPVEPSVTFQCSGPEANYEEIRNCRDRELSGTVVFPSCNGPNFYATQALPHMTCIDGKWDHIANCTINCGTVTPDSKPLISGGDPVKHGELPWHAAIYKKHTRVNRQICGGSILNNDVIISAAHCFWGYDIMLKKFLKQPAEQYAVAVGKIYRRWQHPDEINVQRSDVSKIIFPAEFEGEDRNYQADIAVVKVATPFEYKPYIRPVCLSFDTEFEAEQMENGNKGKVAGWGLTGEDERESPILKVIDLPFIDNVNCSIAAPPTFKQYITLDKFCVGYLNKGISLCKGDSGGGVVFSRVYEGEERFFLRGVVSTAPQNGKKCNTDVYTAMTRISAYENFVIQYY